jgi:hypothetical protein
MSRIARIGAVLSALAAGCLATAAPASADAPLSQADAQRIATDAYVYGIPLMEFMRQARTQTSVTVPTALSDAPINQLGNARHLANVKHQVIVQPNNDTLYSNAHLDLSTEPLVLQVPSVPRHRYYSFEFLDPYTNVFAYVGTRTTGDGAGTFLITGPGWHGPVPRGMRRIRSPYRPAWMVGRTLVLGPGDLPAVHRVQDGYRLLPLAKYLRYGPSWQAPRPQRIITRHHTYTEPTGLAFFDRLGQYLAQNPPPRRDAAILAELKRVGIGPGLEPSHQHLSQQVLAGLRAAVAGGHDHVYALRVSIATPSVLSTGGWFVPPNDTGYYGTDYKFRAVVAIYGIAANRPAEAMYIVGAADQQHALLDGSRRYLIHFTAGQLPPPARYFWSLTVYDQNFFLVPNPINRYELSSHTAGLRHNADGSLDIYVQRDRPAGHGSNWLPAPASGQFQITFRLYGPKPPALNRTYVYPPIARSG